MQVIWKQQIIITDRVSVFVPKGSEILSFQLQNGEPTIWFLCNSDQQQEERFLEIFGTGNPIYSDMGVSRKFIGTIQKDGLVWHLFERLN